MATVEKTIDEPSQAAQIASLPPDMAVLKLENESIQALAAAHPRRMELIKADLADVLKAFPALAEDAVYNKPVGKDPDTGNQKYARNLSIRAAETLREAYGYNSVRTDVSIVDEDTVKVEASFTDYQRGCVWRDGDLVSKFYKSRGGKMQRTPDDRFYSVVVKAAKSKAAREVILRSVNAGLKAWFWDQCELIIENLLDDAAVNKIIGQFSTKGVSLLQIEQFLGRPLKMGWTTEDRKTLLGTWNAIKDGETTVAEVFFTEDPKTDKPPAGNGPVAPGDLTNPQEAPQKEPTSQAPSTSAEPTTQTTGAAAASSVAPTTDKLPDAHPLSSLQAALLVAGNLGEINRAGAPYLGPDSDSELHGTVKRLLEEAKNRVLGKGTNKQKDLLEK